MTGIQQLRHLAAIWGISAVVLLLAYPIYRLSGTAWQAISSGELHYFHWLLIVANILFMAYSEGYQGFQKGFSPRVAARARYLSQHAGLLNGILAPFFCIGYFGTTRRRQIAVIVLSLMLLVLISIVSRFPQPWRGIVDAGVVIGLLWGLISLLVFVWQAFCSENFLHDAELATTSDNA